MPGGGITPTNVARIVDATGVNEVHGSCKTTLPDSTVQTDPKIVKQLINALSR
jgi:copper homeostasis protein CutC